MTEEKSAAEKLAAELCYKPEEAWKVLDDAAIRQADDYCERYKAFLDRAKTEREAVAEAIRQAEEAGQGPAAGRYRRQAHRRGRFHRRRPHRFPPAGHEAQPPV